MGLAVRAYTENNEGRFFRGNPGLLLISWLETTGPQCSDFNDVLHMAVLDGHVTRRAVEPGRRVPGVVDFRPCPSRMYIGSYGRNVIWGIRRRGPSSITREIAKSAKKIILSALTSLKCVFCVQFFVDRPDDA